MSNKKEHIILNLNIILSQRLKIFKIVAIRVKG